MSATLRRIWPLLLLAPAAGWPAAADTASDADFGALEREYAVYFLAHNPVVATYLGGAALDPTLAGVDGTLRDHSARALATEDQHLTEFRKRFLALDPRSLSAGRRIDREVAAAQIAFLLRQHRQRRYQERSLDTYVDEPFRGIDWQLQGLDATGAGHYGSAADWARLIERLNAIPGYLGRAQDQLEAGIQAGNVPDWRQLRAYGLDTTAADATYFAETLPAIAAERIGASNRDALLKDLAPAAARAAAAYRALREFVATRFFEDPSRRGAAALKAEFRGDRFALGSHEYDWALRNNLRVGKTAAELYDEALPIVGTTQDAMESLAREIARAHDWPVPAAGPGAVQAVFHELGADAPHSDEQMIEWYRATGVRLVEYARQTGLFDVPADYRLDVTMTPPPLRSSIEDAAYYPAPPFKATGIGRFYVSPTGNDPAALAQNDRASLADLAAHEGFPGHDWHYKVMTRYRAGISILRWLTPGAVEDSSSMWEDSMAAEGWAFYSEALMAEAQPGAPQGFYTPEERLYQLQGQLMRELRVRLDTGLHTRRLTFDEAVDLFSQVVDFLPGSCHDAEALSLPAKRASCDSAWKVIFRYSRWPTQAITYRLGSDEIRSLRAAAARALGPRFSARDFHVALMKQGTIPVGYFGPELLRELTTAPTAAKP